MELGVIDESDLTGAVEVPPGANIARSPDPTTLVASHFNLVLHTFVLSFVACLHLDVYALVKRPNDR